jgi:hypothetical protein
MAEKYIIKDTTLKGIADAIRAKRETTDPIQVSDMALEIMSISIPEELVLGGITITPTGEEIVKVPTGSIGAFGIVTVEGDQNLIPGNIKKDEVIYGVVGTLEAIDTSDATATAEDIAEGVTAYVNGEKIVGTHVCSGESESGSTEDEATFVLNDTTVTPNGMDFTITPDEGTDGFSAVNVEGDENLKPENILRDVTIYGVTGTADSLSDAYLQEKEVTPAAVDLTVMADEDYAALSKVTVLGDSNLKAENIRAGVEIFGVEGSLDKFDKPMTETTITPSAKEQVVTPDSEHSGFSKVTVAGDDNLVASNIRKGVTIFGVTGTNEGGEDSPMIMGDVVYYGPAIELADVSICE